MITSGMDQDTFDDASGAAPAADQSLTGQPVAGQLVADRIGQGHWSVAWLTQALKAAGEETRLRILALLAEGERSVKDLTDILAQSQPRISRHLKLLLEAGLIDRHREGTWAFFRLSDGPGGELARALAARLSGEDATVVRDRGRLNTLRQAQRTQATEHFGRIAESWDELRLLHADDGEVEAAIAAMLPDDIAFLVDLGTGTARMLELLAGRFRRAIGVDQSQDMLFHARARLEEAGLTAAQVRRGDIYDPGVEIGGADVVIMHQVLHFLDDPAAAVNAAGGLLVPGGVLMIVDFEPHGLELLRSEHAHRRLGFSTAQITTWLSEADLSLAATRSIAAPAADDGREQLSVGVWLAGKDATTAREAGAE